jgi:hypothetical protein
MGSWTVVTIEGPAAALPTTEKLDEVLMEHDLGSALNLSDYTERRTDDPARLVLSWWDERWSVDGLQEACVEVSEKFPDTVVEHVEEWDTMDADEAGKVGTAWRAGKVIRRARTVFEWTEVPA